MIPPIAEIAAVAGILGNAANIIDKIYGRFFERKEGKPPPAGLSPDAEYSTVIRDAPGQKALVSKNKQGQVDKVTYEELAQRLTPEDMRFIKTHEKTMTSYYEQWEAAYPTLALEDDPIRRKRLEQRLDQVLDALAKELAAILGFIEKAGLQLDDHYYAFRSLAGQ